MKESLEGGVLHVVELQRVLDEGGLSGHCLKHLLVLRMRIASRSMNKR